MYTINEDANLIQLSDFQATDESDHLLTANITMISDLGSGRPLGATFTPDGSTLYICDMVLGLTRLRNPQDPKSKVELVASSVMDNGTNSRIFLADDVACCGPKDWFGILYRRKCHLSRARSKSEMGCNVFVQSGDADRSLGKIAEI
jgi:hypothetical protein